MNKSSTNLKLDLTDLAPGILAQLGPRALANLHAMAQEYQRKAAEAGYSLDDLARMAASGNGLDDENIPDLVKSFESTDIDAN